jgi:DNA repair protein RadA
VSKPPSPDTSFGDPKEAAGGNVIGHALTCRIHLRKSGENRTAKTIDSCCHPYSDAKFILNEKGTDDLEDE